MAHSGESFQISSKIFMRISGDLHLISSKIVKALATSGTLFLGCSKDPQGPCTGSN